MSNMKEGVLQRFFGSLFKREHTLGAVLKRIKGDGWGLLIRIGSEDGDRFFLIEDFKTLRDLSNENLFKLLSEVPEPPKFPTYTTTLLHNLTKHAHFDLTSPTEFNFDSRLYERLEALRVPMIEVDDYSQYEVLGRAEFDEIVSEISENPDWFALEAPMRVPSQFSKQMALNLPAVDLESDTAETRADAARRAEATIRKAFPEDDLYAIDHIYFERIQSPVWLRQSPPASKGEQKTATADLPVTILLQPVASLSAEDAFTDYAAKEAHRLIPQDALWSNDFAKRVTAIAEKAFGAKIEDCCLDNGRMIYTVGFQARPNLAVVPHFRISREGTA